jgi:hypothetical protein
MSTFESVSQFDEQLLNDVLTQEKFEWINSYDIKIKMFFKCGKYDREGNLKTPALTKNGVVIPSQTKIVSSFNRITDNVDVKIILNKEYWDELNKDEREAVLVNALYYLEVREDKMGEPLTISDECDKVQLKLKKPDFYCEGFLSLIDEYKSNYIPYQDARCIANKISIGDCKQTNEENEDVKVVEKQKPKVKNIEIDETTDEDEEINLDDIIVE